MFELLTWVPGEPAPHPQAARPPALCYEGLKKQVYDMAKITVFNYGPFHTIHYPFRQLMKS